MIECANAPLASGKTYQIAHKVTNNLSEGLSSLVLVPTHAAAQEVISMVPKIPFNGYVVHLRGKSNETCLPDHEQKTCTRCPIYKRAFGGDESTLNELLERVTSDAQGSVFDLAELRKRASEFELCPMILSRLLGLAKQPRVVVTAQAYLATKTSFKILSQVQVDKIYVDEADCLFETLLDANQRQLVMMEPRQKKAHTIREGCNQECKNCRPHLADHVHSQIRPYSGKIETFGGIGDINNTYEILQDAINRTEKAVANGTILDVFNFPNIKQALTNIVNAFPDCNDSMDTMSYLKKLEEKNEKSAVRLFEETDDIAIPIEVGAVVTDAFDELGENDDPDDTRMRLSALKKRLLLEQKSTDNVGEDFNTFLSFVDFLNCAPGFVYLFSERRPLGSPEPHVQRCRVVLRYLNTDQYKRAFDYLEGRCKLLSGTFLNREMVAANLLVESHRVNLSMLDTDFHKSALIIAHNPNRRDGTKDFPLWCAPKLYESIQSQLPDLKVLHFATNTKKAGETFKAFCEMSSFSQKFKIENRHKGLLERDLLSSCEESEDSRTAIACIDKLRSSMSRAANRKGFNLCTVIGNGVANWNNRIVLYMESRKLHPHISLGNIIQYEQTRAVVQALMRAPRSSELTVCLYVGDLHAKAYPSFLQNRLVTVRELVPTYKLDKGVTEVDLQKLETVIDVVAHCTIQFLRDEPLKIERQAIATPDPVAVGLDLRKDAIDGRLRHLDDCMTAKGYIDRTTDKKGERTAWNAFLDELEQHGVISKEKVGRKTVYKKLPQGLRG